MRADDFLELDEQPENGQQTLGADAFLDAESFLDSDGPEGDQALEPEVEPVPSMNMGRGAVERGGDLLGGLFTATNALSETAEETYPLGGLVWEDGIVPDYKGPDEYTKWRSENGGDEPLKNAADYWSNFDAGYVENHTWEKLKQEFSEGGALSGSAWAEVMAYGAEQGVKSIPDMIAVMANLPAYVAARSGEIGQERAKNKGKEEAELTDVVEAFPAALGSAILERIGAKGITQAGAETLGKEAIKQGFAKIGKEGLKAGAKEATTEFFQEGVIEYLGERLGTDAAMSIWESLDRGAAGAVAGGVYGTGAGVGGAAVNEVRNRKRGAQEPETEEAPASDAEQPAPESWTDAVLAEEFLDSQDDAPAAKDDNAPVDNYEGRPEWATDQTNIFRDGTQPEVQTEARPEAEQEPAGKTAPEPEQAGSEPTESGTGVFRVPVDQIKVDPQQYQFRSRVNEQGVDQRLSGVKKWDDRRAGSVLLHRRENGDLYVADGHHRVDLAKKLSQGEINAQIIDEADGIDVAEARVEAAMNNIADNKAEPIDVAKVFRDSEVPTQDVRDTFNLPTSQVVRDGESLSKLTDNVFGMVTAGQMTEKDGAAIGSAFTEQAQQEAAAEAFQKVQPDTEYQRQLLANEIRAADFAQAQGEQGGLFGDDPQEVSLMQDRLKVLDSLRQRLNSDKRLFKSLNDNAGRAGEVGNQIATEANESITQQSARSLDLIGRVTTTPALNEMVNRAARRVYDGENRSKVVTELKQELMSYEQGADAANSRPDGAPQGRKQAPESGQEPRASERVPEQDTAGEDQGGQSEGQQQEVAPTLDLETQTEEQLAEQARAREEAQQAETDQRRQEEQRAQADEQVDDFTLTGSDRTADVAMAAGQNDMFVSTPASRQVDRAGTETDTKPSDGQPGSEISWKKDGKRIWRANDGQIITDESFGVGGARVSFFPVYANTTERNAGNNYASGESLAEAKSKATPQDNSGAERKALAEMWRQIGREYPDVEYGAVGNRNLGLMKRVKEAIGREIYGPEMKQIFPQAEREAAFKEGQDEVGPKSRKTAPRRRGKPELIAELDKLAEKAKTLPIKVSPDDVSFQAAENAYKGISFSPDDRAIQEQMEYLQEMIGLYESMSKLATTDDKKADLQSELARYKQGYLKRNNAILSAKGRTMSSMITGGSNFPTARNQKRLDSERKRVDEFLEWRKKAQASIRKTLSPETAAISSTDSDALTKLQAKLSNLEEAQERMKAANKIAKSKKLSDDEKVAQLQDEAKLTEKQAKGLLEPDFAGRIGFPSYSLSNNNAEIRRIKQRIQDLESRKETAESVGGMVAVEFDGGIVEVDFEAGYVRIMHDEKPSAGVRQELKSGGFRWTPSQTAWRRKLSNQALYKAAQITGAQMPESVSDASFSRDGYRRSPESRIESLSADEATAIASGLMRDWKGRPPVTIAEQISEFPMMLQAAIRMAGAESDMRAVFWNDHVYILAPRIPNRAALEEVILHEVVGHYGLRKMVGGGLKPLLDRVYRDMGDTARAKEIKKTYFGSQFDPRNSEHRLTVAEELLAHLAESGQQRHRTLWQRIVTAVREGLRRLGFTVRMGEADLLKILAGAQRAVEQAAFVQEASGAARFRRDDDRSETRERQVKFWDGFTTQPLDRMFRALFDVTGMVDSHGRMKAGVSITEGAERIIKEWRPNPSGHFTWMDGILETARHGLIDRYKLSDDYKMAWRQAEAYGRNLDMQAMDILKTLEERGVQGTEAAVLQKILTGETVGDFQMEAVATPIRHAIDDLGQAAVEYGIITREQFERNRGEYLHRSYLKHEGEFTGLGKFIHNQQRKQNRKIKGDTAKGRGIQVRVKTDKIMRHVPVGWYGVQKKGQKPDLQALNGERFTMLENPGVIAEATGTLEGVDTVDQSRTTETVYWPTSQPIPARYDTWRKRGTFEVRGARGDQVTLWRDYSKAEREHMGEILDARYNIAKTFQMLSRDLAMGKFFADVSQNTEWFRRDEPITGVVVSPNEVRSLRALSLTDWVQVPTTTVSQSAGTKQWGALAGGYVRAEIWRDLNELDKMHNPGMWRKILTQWKLNKTARSPVVHMNNVMSNLMLMDLADVRTVDLYKGIQSYHAKDEHWRAAQEYGAFEGTFINEEIRKRVLDPILDDLTKQGMETDPGAEGTVQTLSRMGYTIWRKLKRFDEGMTNLYQVEDELFRMATYMRRLDLGDSPIDAARIAREQFLDYDIRAPWVNVARRTVLPFIAYTYRAVPVVAQSIIHRPWKLAKYFTVAYLANSMAFLLAPGDEDEERRTMRDDQQGMTWIGTPRMLRMPWKDEHDNPVYMDIRRWIPAGDVFDMNQGNSALPIPAPIQFGGPLMLGFEFALNKQAFTGEEIVNRDTDTTGEAVGKTADWLYKSWMPSAAYVPGSYYWEKFWKAEEGARDILGRPYSMSQALLSSVGIKVQPHDVRLGMEFRSRDLASQARTIKADMRRAESDLNRGIINKIEFNKIRSRSREKLERLIEAQKKLTGKE